MNSVFAMIAAAMISFAPAAQAAELRAAAALPEGSFQVAMINWKEARINDPDGYTNVRSGPGTKYAVIAAFYEDEIFLVAPNDGQWWKVMNYDEDIEGWMHVSRIQLVR